MLEGSTLAPASHDELRTRFRPLHALMAEFEDVDALTNNLDIRQEHLELVGYNLASRLADDYGRGGEITNRVISRAEALLQGFLELAAGLPVVAARRPDLAGTYFQKKRTFFLKLKLYFSFFCNFCCADIN